MSSTIRHNSRQNKWLILAKEEDFKEEVDDFDDNTDDGGTKNNSGTLAPSEIGKLLQEAAERIGRGAHDVSLYEARLQNDWFYGLCSYDCNCNCWNNFNSKNYCYF